MNEPTPGGGPKTRFIECGVYKGKGMAVFTSGGDSQGNFNDENKFVFLK